MRPNKVSVLRMLAGSKGESINFVKSKLMDKNAAIYQWLDPDPVQELLNQHFSGLQNRRLLVWSLLNVDQWLKEYIVWLHQPA